MNRRRYLLLVGAVTSLAGCAARGSGGRDETATGPGTPATGRAPRPPPASEVDLPVSTAEMRQPLPRDYIPAIVDPAFGADWSGLDAGGRDSTFPGDAPVLGVARGGRARAYPLRVLNHHEVVNDEFSGSIAVTYCVLCGSAVTFRRRVAGRPSVFGVSGKLWQSDLVMYDRRTGTLWSQLLATGINGPRTGERLDLLPTRLTTWQEWREEFPATRVLLPPPRSGTLGTYDRSFDYFSPAYGYGDEDQLVGLDSVEGGIHQKTLVIGVVAGGTSRAYPYVAVADTRGGVVNDRVGGRPVVVATTPEGNLVAYDRRVDGQPRQFGPAGTGFLRGAGSRWRRTTGRAVDGRHEGDRLRRANDLPPMFWYGWSKFYRDTELYGIDVEADSIRPLERRVDAPRGPPDSPRHRSGTR
ncbi:MAG: DUF3179 domain-containing protein [Salinirussus sp.]